MTNAMKVIVFILLMCSVYMLGCTQPNVKIEQTPSVSPTPEQYEISATATVTNEEIVVTYMGGPDADKVKEIKIISPCIKSLYPAVKSTAVCSVNPGETYHVM